MKVCVLSRDEYRPIHAPHRPLVVLLHAAHGPNVSEIIQPFVPVAAEALNDSPLDVVYFIDISAAMKELPAEGASQGLGPISKPLSRVLAKLNVQECTLVASQLGCQAALGLLTVRW